MKDNVTVVVVMTTLFGVAAGVLWLIGWAANRMDEGARRSAIEDRPKHIEACTRYGVAFDVPTKWDNEFGCLQKRSDGWTKVDDRR